MSTLSKKNILFIFSDQHASTMLGALNPAIRTPNLDRLAQQGVLFQNACCPSPVCVPSRASLMTTRFPHEVGVLGNDDVLGSDEPTFAHAMTNAGYETALIGRMHFRGPDQHHGFMIRRVGDVSSEHRGERNDLGPFSFNSGTQLAALQNSGAGTTGYYVFDEEVKDATVKELQDWKQRKNSNPSTPPFCHVVGFMLPHSPYRAPRKAFDEYAGKVKLPDRLPVENASDFVKYYRNKCKLDEATEADELRSLAAYYALVTETDRRIGEILQALADAGEQNNTIVIYSSDHGEHGGDHQLWWKQSYYQSSVGIPLIIRDPDVSAGQVVKTPVSLVDIGATMIDYADGKQLPRTRGMSLRPLLADTKKSREQPVMSELGCFGLGVASRMARQENWKYIYYHHPDIRDELYDLESDPRERNNRAQDPQCTSIREKLRGLVFDGWDPEKIIRHHERSCELDSVIVPWVKLVTPPDPWKRLLKIPVSVNQKED
jgi:choline-sulfatase